MNEHENVTGHGGDVGNFPVLDSRGTTGAPRKADLVVDLSGIQQLDLSDLALLLTAQQKAQQEGRVVWLAGVPLGIWQALQAMGLGRYFRPFPVSGKVAV
ncbi:STAS domain-containing protein [Gemmatimonadota bacterium]